MFDYEKIKIPTSSRFRFDDDFRFESVPIDDSMKRLVDIESDYNIKRSRYGFYEPIQSGYMREDNSYSYLIDKQDNKQQSNNNIPNIYKKPEYIHDNIYRKEYKYGFNSILDKTLGIHIDKSKIKANVRSYYDDIPDRIYVNKYNVSIDKFDHVRVHKLNFDSCSLNELNKCVVIILHKISEITSKNIVILDIDDLNKTINDYLSINPTGSGGTVYIYRNINDNTYFVV